MAHRRATDAPEYVVAGRHVRGVATPSQGSAEVTVVRAVLEPGATEPPHQHDREEVVVVLSGETASATIGPEEHTLEPRDTLIIPPQTTHQFTNTGDTPLETIAIERRHVSGVRTRDGMMLTPWKNSERNSVPATSRAGHPS